MGRLDNLNDSSQQRWLVEERLLGVEGEADHEAEGCADCACVGVAAVDQ